MLTNEYLSNNKDFSKKNDFSRHNRNIINGHYITSLPTILKRPNETTR